MQTGSQGLVILSYATVSLSIHVIEQCKNCREISEDKVEFVRKLRVYGVGTLRIQHA